MNGNNGFNIISTGHQTTQFMQPINYQQQPQFPVQNVQFISDVRIQQQSILQNGTENIFTSPQVNNGQNYCINSNGATYFAVANSQQPQCFQAVETPQGLQLFQVITNPVIGNSQHPPVCVQNVSQTPVFQPQFVQTNPLTVQIDGVPCNEQEPLNEPENSEEEDEYEEEPENYNDQSSETNQNVDSKNNPLVELANFTFSQNDQNVVFNQSPVFHQSYNQVSATSCVPVLNTVNNTAPQQPSFIYSLPANGQQQLVPQTFQVLVNTPQGMAIQTVVANYPPQMMPVPAINGSIVNSNLPSSVEPLLQSVCQTNVDSNNAAAPLHPLKCPPAAVQQVKSVTSPSHKTSADVSTHFSEPSLPSSSDVATSVPVPVPSPHCLPDSTEDLCQPTIKQTTSNVVDGIDLEDIREFARTFKMRRLVLGLTQTQVGQALSATEGPAYSQSAICRFEKLDITPRSAMKIRPVLENWLKEAEEQHQYAHLTGLEYVGMPGIGKIRKRRTFFSTEALAVLNARFEKNSHPSGRDISSIAYEIGYQRDVVRVWFCNKRQSLRHCNTFQRHHVSGFKSDPATASSDSAHSPNPSSSNEHCESPCF